MQDSHPTTTSRRRVLRSAGAALTAAAAGSAGCLSSLPPLGSQIEFGRVDVPDAPFSPDYRKYTPSPTVFGHDFYHGAPVAIVPSAFADDRVARRNSIGRSIVMSATEYYGRPFEDYEMAVNLGAASVLTGPIQRSNVAAFLADTGYSPAGSAGRFDLYDRPDGDRVLAVADGTIVRAAEHESAAAVNYLLKLVRGDEPTYHETDETFARFSERVGLSPATTYNFPVGKPAGEEPLHSSLSFRFDDDALYYVFDHVYEVPRRVSQSAIRDQLREMSMTDRPLLVDTEVDGRFATVEIRRDRPTEVERPREQPHVMWGWEIDQSGRTVTLHHEAGDDFPAEYAEIEYANEPLSTQFTDEFDVVEPGDSLTVQLPDDRSDDRLIVVYDLGNDSSVHLLSVSLEASL